MNDELREDAPPEVAIARERRLQRYRERFARGRAGTDAESLAALEWIDGLAAEGHVGAERLLERAAGSNEALEALRLAAPALVERMAAHARWAASYLARVAAAQPEPDLERLQRYLTLGTPHDPLHAESLRVFLAAGGVLETEDLALLREHLESPFHGVFHGLELRDQGLLYQFALRRIDGHSSQSRQLGEALMQRAADSGSRSAWEALWRVRFDAAPNKAAFMQEWFNLGRPPVIAGRLACAKLGVMFERGTGGAPRNEPQAIRWYERALMGKSAWRTDGEGVLAGFCADIARALDCREKDVIVNDAPLAMAWYERGLQLGDERCMNRWLRGIADGNMGVEPDPEVAMARASAFRARRPDLDEIRFVLAMGVLAAAHRARRLKEGSGADAVAATRWLEVAALLGHPKTIEEVLR